MQKSLTMSTINLRGMMCNLAERAIERCLQGNDDEDINAAVVWSVLASRANDVPKHYLMEHVLDAKKTLLRISAVHMPFKRIE